MTLKPHEGLLAVRRGKGRCYSLRRPHMDTFSALAAICEGIPSGTPYKPVMRCFDVLVVLSLNKQSCCYWSGTSWQSRDVTLSTKGWVIRSFQGLISLTQAVKETHHDVIKWEHFPGHWPFVWGIHRSSANSPHKGQWRGALMFSFICAWTKDWVTNRDTAIWDTITFIITSL